MEYITGFFVDILIILVGFELLKSSIDKIINPEGKYNFITQNMCEKISKSEIVKGDMRGSSYLLCTGTGAGGLTDPLSV